MSRFFKEIVLILATLSLLNTSCRQEEYAFEGTPLDQSIRAGAKITGLLQNVALNDGSTDDILDGANCITLELPVTVIIDGESYTVHDESDYYTIEALLETAIDTVPTLVYPVSVILQDYTKLTLDNDTELEDLTEDCDEDDDDIECIDVVYPITVSLFNNKTEILKKENILNDKSFLNFIKDLDEADLVEITFPVDLVLKDGSIINVPNLTSLEDTIESYADDCDEQDDFEHGENEEEDDDEDDEEYDEESINELWVSCLEWEVQVFRLDDVNLTAAYANYVFAPLEDGTIRVSSDSETFLGTWSTSSDGEGMNVTLSMNIDGLDDFNGDWTVNEVTIINGVSRLNLKIDNSVLLFKNGCE